VQIVWLIVGLTAVAVGVYLVFWRRQRPEHPGSEVDAQKEYLLVLLRRSAAVLTDDSLEAAARTAWGKRFGPNSDGSAYVDPGSSELVFILEAHGNAFLVIRSERGKRQLQTPKVFHPARAADLWSEYSHDVSVGLAHDFDTDRAKLQAYVGSLAAALADELTIGLLHPSSGQVWQLDRAVLERLAANPEEFFSRA
jgi:hypothetical protein